MPSSQNSASNFAPMLGPFAPAFEYMIDAAQRAVLGHEAPARQSISRASDRDRSARPQTLVLNWCPR